MDRLAAAQADLLRVLYSIGDRHFFLRRAADDSALWVCDLPRRQGRLERYEEALAALDVDCRMDEARRLWLLDWTLERYAALSRELPGMPPFFPKQEHLHDAYALCRLLLAHPSEVSDQPLPLTRAFLKHCGGQQDALLACVPRWHADCAALLRSHQPLPSLAGQALSEWLMNEEHE